MSCTSLFQQYFTMCNEAKFRINEIWDIQRKEYGDVWHKGMVDSQELKHKKMLYNDYLRVKDIHLANMQTRCPTMYDFMSSMSNLYIFPTKYSHEFPLRKTF